MMSVPERRVPERLTHHAPHTGSGLATAVVCFPMEDQHPIWLSGPLE